MSHSLPVLLLEVLFAVCRGEVKMSVVWDELEVIPAAGSAGLIPEQGQAGRGRWSCLEQLIWSRD